MMGAGIVADSVVFFGLFVWIGFAALLAGSFLWMLRATRGFKEKYNALREPAGYESGVILNIGVAGGRVDRSDPKKQKRAA
jgi:hypothetical protein